MTPNRKKSYMILCYVGRFKAQAEVLNFSSNSADSQIIGLEIENFIISIEMFIPQIRTLTFCRREKSYQKVSFDLNVILETIGSSEGLDFGLKSRSLVLAEFLISIDTASKFR